jgi:16S rRNA (uracil1498-N3)-methyltransferase
MPKNLKPNNKNTEPHNLFYTPPENIQDDEVTIDGKEFHHLKNVLRKKLGDTIFSTDGRGNKYKSEISQIKKSIIKAKIFEKEHIKEKNIANIKLAFVPLKGTRSDFIIEKGTELGVKEFIPFISNFSVITNLSQIKIKRFKKIAISAMLQSQQYYMPKIIARNSINGLLGEFKNFDLVLVANKDGNSKIPPSAKSILFIVGPEGGFDASEIELFKNNSAILLSLGPNRLRSETAAITGTVKILTAYGII